MDVYISGVGMTEFGRSKEPLQKMMAGAASSALKEAQLERVDAIYMGVMNVEEFVGDSNFAVLLADTLGLTGIPSTRVETASSTGAGAFEAACYALASGHMKHVLVLAGEEMTHLPTAKTTRIHINRNRLVEPGLWYNVEVMAIVVELSKKGDSTNTNVDFQVLDGPFKGGPMLYRTFN